MMASRTVVVVALLLLALLSVVTLAALDEVAGPDGDGELATTGTLQQEEEVETNPEYGTPIVRGKEYTPSRVVEVQEEEEEEEEEFDEERFGFVPEFFDDAIATCMKLPLKSLLDGRDQRNNSLETYYRSYPGRG